MAEGQIVKRLALVKGSRARPAPNVWGTCICCWMSLECVRSDAVRLQHQSRVDVVSVKRTAKQVDELLSAGHTSCRRQANVSKACQVVCLSRDTI